MSKPIIAVDIDDVLSASAAGLTAYSNKRWGLDLRAEDYDENWAKFWGVSLGVAKEMAHEVHERDIFKNFAHFEQAIPVLRALKEKYELIVVTSRRINLKTSTASWLERNFSDIFSAVHHAGFYDNPHDPLAGLTKNKAMICNELGVDYLIDDQLKHCLAVADCGKGALLFGDYNWNRIDVAEVQSKNITIVHTWADVKEYFDGKG